MEINRLCVRSFEGKDATEFKILNLEWLTRYDLLEPVDLQYLDHPEQMIIEKGGRILIATIDRAVVGTCAILRVKDGTAELAKLSVKSEAQGQGVGWALIKRSIEIAREIGFSKLILISNKKLNTALKLYTSFGFIFKPVPEGVEYKTANIYMEKNIVDGQ